MPGDLLKCEGQTLQDCGKCNMFFTIHSEHYDKQLNRKVSTVGCSFGGHRIFDEDGDLLKQY